MIEPWVERADGYFYPRGGRMSLAMRARLQMLIYDGEAEDRGCGILIPFERAVLFSEKDAALLKIPPLNPYRLSMRRRARRGSTIIFRSKTCGS